MHIASATIISSAPPQPSRLQDSAVSPVRASAASAIPGDSSTPRSPTTSVRGSGSAAQPATRVSLSEQARAVLQGSRGVDNESGETEVESDAEERAESAVSGEATSGEKKAGGDSKLSAEDQRQVTDMKKRDTEVRAHEAAHVAAAGGNTNGPIQYEFERGPDNQQYAVGGHVSIDTSAVAGDPAKTLQKAQKVRAAALAPADPSGADKQVAAKASRTADRARSELAAQKQTQSATTSEGTTAADGPAPPPSIGDIAPRLVVPVSRAISSYAAAAAAA